MKEQFADEAVEMEKFTELNRKRKRSHPSRRHEHLHGFRCAHCHTPVTANPEMGTKHRNHCAVCLWSKHVDGIKPGDRKSQCGGGMQPIGLTLKIEGTDKYTGQVKLGDVMLIHACTSCDKISINRVAADDSPLAVMDVFEKSTELSQDVRNRLIAQRIVLLAPDERAAVETRLYGRQNPQT